MRNIDALLTALVQAPNGDRAIELAETFTLSELKALADLLYLDVPTSPAKRPLARRIAAEARA